MTDREALYQSILANPDDDAPRLVFADWLEENGEPERAEFIRVQCEWERVPEYSKPWQQLAKRQNALVKAHKKEWTATVKGMATYAYLRRGFVDKITVRIGRFLENGESLFEREPIREIKLVYEDRQMSEVLTRLAASPLLGRLRGLDFENVPIGDAVLLRLLESTHLENLQSLVTGFPGPARITMTGIAALLSSAAVPKLESLSIAQLDPGDTPFHRIVQVARWPPQLRRLRLRTPRLPEDDLARAVTTDFLSSLELLHLENIGRPCAVIAQALAGSTVLTHLRQLRFWNCDIGDTGATALAKSPSNSPLQYLNLHRCRITNSGARALLESPSLSGLLHLDLGGNRIDNDLQKQFRERFGVGVCTFAG